MKAAIIGFGRTGMAHYCGYRASGIEVAAVCGRTTESVREKLAHAGLAAKALSVEEMLALSDIGVVSICTPPEYHATQVVAAAAAGKHLIIEKPIALNVQELATMGEAIARAGVITGTSFVWRWLPGPVSMLRRRDELGEMVHMRADFWNGRKRPRAPDAPGPVMGTMERTGCHAVDMVVSLVGERAVSVRALGTPQTLSLLVEFERGSSASITSSDEACRPLGFALSANGSKGSIDLHTDGSLFNFREGGSRQSLLLPARRDPYTFNDLPFTSMVGSFLASMKKGEDTSAGFNHSRHVHKIGFAAARSAARSGDIVYL